MYYNVLARKLQKEGEKLFQKRSYLPLILLIIGISIKYVDYLCNPYPHLNVEERSVLMFSSVFLGILGLSIRVITVGYSPANTSGRNTDSGQIADQLNTKGSYSLMRNPLYLGNYLMWIAIAIFIRNPWFVVVFTLTFWIYYERIIYSEEEFLTQKFGNRYLAWASQTPIFLPFHFRYKKATIPFSWKKALKKEKNGLFAFFLILFLFNVLENSLYQQKLVFEWTFLSAATLVSCVLYFVLKYIKKYTNWLNEDGR